MIETTGRIQSLFKNKTTGILSIYFTAGHPHLNSTLPVLKALQKNGADLVELGMPYSDPLADGSTIQSSAAQALANGMTLAVLFEQLEDFRQDISLPVILMGYINPILQYGFEKFCADAASVGIDGLILPDLPPFEFEAEYGAIIKKYGLDFSFLVTPETPDERILKLDALSSGFLYIVSSSSITGTNKNFDAVTLYLQRLKNLNLKNPMLVGFGIKNKAAFDVVCEQANGGIIGTAFINALEDSEDTKGTVKNFIGEFK